MYVNDVSLVGRGWHENSNRVRLFKSRSGAWLIAETKRYSVVTHVDPMVISGMNNKSLIDIVDVRNALVA
jgi:hypothetical protein